MRKIPDIAVTNSVSETILNAIHSEKQRLGDELYSQSYMAGPYQMKKFAVFTIVFITHLITSGYTLEESIYLLGSITNEEKNQIGAITEDVQVFHEFELARRVIKLLNRRIVS